MGNFYDAMTNTTNNVSVTENGMVGYKTTNHALLDFNFKVASYRHNVAAGVEDFKKVLAEKDQYALKYLFYLRDVREGMGERHLFRECLKAFVNNSTISYKDRVIKKIINETSNYGRFDDLFVLLDTDYANLVFEKCKNQLSEDYDNYVNKKSVSLLAKWMPSVNASAKTRQLALRFVKAFNTTEREYRKMLSDLRKHLKIVEQKMCDREWDSIDYNAVPSKANLKYKEAFLRNDEARRREFLAKLIAGDKTVKINSTVLFPHEIVSKYVGEGWRSEHVKAYDASLEAMWKGLKECVGLNDTIVVRDGSGSMTSHVGGTNVTALSVSTALAIYCSEHTNAAFKDKFITFSSKAKLIDLSKCGSLQAKVKRCYEEGDCSNTNLKNVFNLILNTAVDNNMKQEEIPSTVLVISDMEFDGRWFNGGGNVIAAAASDFAAHGYKLPKLAFWNVNSRTGTIPVKQNENGVVLISGFSQNVLSMVMNGKTDPYDALVEELTKERYEKIPLINYCNSTKNVVKYKSVKREKPSFLK